MRGERRLRLTTAAESSEFRAESVRPLEELLLTGGGFGRPSDPVSKSSFFLRLHFERSRTGMSLERIRTAKPELVE